jgi:hypothetical protein
LAVFVQPRHEEVCYNAAGLPPAALIDTAALPTTALADTAGISPDALGDAAVVTSRLPSTVLVDSVTCSPTAFIAIIFLFLFYLIRVKLMTKPGVQRVNPGVTMPNQGVKLMTKPGVRSPKPGVPETCPQKVLLLYQRVEPILKKRAPLSREVIFRNTTPVVKLFMISMPS